MEAKVADIFRLPRWNDDYDERPGQHDCIKQKNQSVGYEYEFEHVADDNATE